MILSLGGSLRGQSIRTICGSQDGLHPDSTWSEAAGRMPA